MAHDEKMRSLVRGVLVVLGLIVGMAAALAFLYVIRHVIFVTVLGIFFALVLEPLVRRLMHRRLRRPWAAGLALLVTFLVFTSLVGAVVGPVVSETRNLIDNAPEILEKIRTHPQLQPLDERYQIFDRAKAFLHALPSHLQQGALPLAHIVTGVVTSISTLAIILVLAFFLSVEGPGLWESAAGRMRPEKAAKARYAVRQIARAVSGYVTGNVLISLIAGSVALVTMWIAGVPYKVALAVLFAFLDLIPMIGATLGTVVVTLVSLSQGVGTAIIVLAVLLAYQVVENHAIQPLVYAKTNKLSPLFIVLATLVGIELGGIAGALLAIPGASIMQIAYQILVADRLPQPPSGDQAGRRTK